MDINQKEKSDYAVRPQLKRTKQNDTRADIIIYYELVEYQHLLLEIEINNLRRELKKYEKASKEALENIKTLSDLFEAG